AQTRTFEYVLLIKGNTVEPRIVANADTRLQVLRRDRKRALTFAVDFAGDARPSCRCRLTRRGTLACLIDPYNWGVEFKKMPVLSEQLCEVRASVCVVPKEE